MKIRFLLLFVFVFLGAQGFAQLALAHDSIPLEADGCHECLAEDGCFFFDYWSVPRVTRHCHMPKTVAVTTSVSVSLNEEKPDSNPYEARVLKVLTGNEIEVEFENNKSGALVRLLGVENPASYDADSPLLCQDKMEQGAREYLKDLVLDKKVELRPSLRGEDALEDGTLLRMVFRKKTFINEKILEDGYGILDKDSAFEFLSDFSEADALARREEKGMWEPKFCEEKERGALLGMLLSQISRYQSLPAMLQYAFAALGVLGIYFLGRLIRRSRVAAEA